MALTVGIIAAINALGYFAVIWAFRASFRDLKSATWWFATGFMILAGAGVAGTKNRVADAQNGRSIIRLTRDISTSGGRPRFEALPTAPISQMFQGNDRPYTVITAYRPTDTSTGYIWSASENANGDASSEQIALIRRSGTASSVRRQLLEGTTNDVSWGQVRHLASRGSLL